MKRFLSNAAPYGAIVAIIVMAFVSGGVEGRRQVQAEDPNPTITSEANDLRIDYGTRLHRFQIQGKESFEVDDQIRSAAMELMEVLCDKLPPGPDQKAALDKLHECVLHASYAVQMESDHGGGAFFGRGKR